MFTILTPDMFVSSRWKNGGGTTHEIVRDDRNSPWQWRISIAEVASDGPFSSFEGLSRILTVIEGQGLDLQTPTAVLPARCLQPLAFAGDLPVQSRMVNGPVRNLNLIFDPVHISASVKVLNGSGSILSAEPSETGILCLKGAIHVDGQTVPPGAFGMGRARRVAAGQDALGILILLERADRS